MSDTTDVGELDDDLATNPSDDSYDDVGEQDDDPVISPSHETADKISRRQAKAEEAERLQAELAELREFVQPLMQEKAFKAKAEELGVNASEIDSEDYSREFKKYKAKGLSTEDATETALRIVGGGTLKQVNDESLRESGRMNAQLPPNRTSPSTNVYKQEDLAKMPQSQYDEIMNLHDEGKVRIIT